MLYLTCSTITSVDLAHYGVSRAKDWVSGDCGTNLFTGEKFGYEIIIAIFPGGIVVGRSGIGKGRSVENCFVTVTPDLNTDCVERS